MSNEILQVQITQALTLHVCCESTTQYDQMHSRKISTMILTNSTKDVSASNDRALKQQGPYTKAQDMPPEAETAPFCPEP